MLDKTHYKKPEELMAQFRNDKVIVSLLPQLDNSLSGELIEQGKKLGKRYIVEFII